MGLDSLKYKRGVDNMGNGWWIPWTEREQLLTTRKGRQVGAGVPGSFLYQTGMLRWIQWGQ